MSAGSASAPRSVAQSPEGTLLVFTENRGWGGAALYLSELVHAVRPLYRQVVVVSNQGGLDGWDCADPIFEDASVRWDDYRYLTRREVRESTRHVSWKLMTGSLWLYDRATHWAHRRLAARILKRYKPDAVFCANHGAQSIIWPMMELCGRSGIPAATYLLGLPDMFDRRPERVQSRLDEAMWNASRFVITNALAVAAATSAQRGTPEDKWIIIPNGIADASVPSRPAAARRVRIGTLGRLTPGKGVAIAIEALAELTSDGLDAELVVAGEGPDADALKARVADLGVADRVRFAGHIPDDGVQDFFENIDVFVLASLSEGLPYVVMEAMRAQLPIVATRVGGVPEMLENGQAGILVQPGEVRSLADALGGLVSDAELRRVLGERARRRFAAHYTNSRMHDSIRQAFIAHGMVSQPTDSTAAASTE